MTVPVWKKIGIGLFVIALATLSARALDFPKIAGGVKGDEATYVGIVLSLAYDGDVRYEKGDLDRYRALYPAGPSGIFLKRTPVGSGNLYLAKSFAYAYLAAPFARLGGLGGVFILNVLLLVGAAWCAVVFCQARMGRVAGLILGIAFVGASVVPVYATFLTPEIFNFTLTLVAYFLWLYKHASDRVSGVLASPWTDIAAAALIGVVTYSKLSVLIAPLLFFGIFTWSWRHLLRVAATFVVAFVGLLAIHTMISGEANYQGGERRSFYDRYPFSDPAATFDSIKATEMTTNDADAGMVFAPDTLRLLPANTYYFFAGRDAGLIPYYFPGVFIGAMWLVRLRRASLWQWATFLGLAGSALALLLYFPFTWNGAGGPPGNRYFLAAYPVMLFLLPAGSGLLTALTSAVVGAAFCGAMVLSPFSASIFDKTQTFTWRAPLRWLPIELSIVDDLPVRLDHNRSRVLFIRDPTVYFYYMDGNTYYAEGAGLWIRGGSTAEIVIRTDRPLTRLQLTLTSKVPNVVSYSIGGRREQSPIEREGIAIARLAIPDGYGVHVHNETTDSYAYVLHLETTAGFVPKEIDPRSTDDRNLGVFVRPTFMFGPRGDLKASGDAPAVKVGGG